MWVRGILVEFHRRVRPRRHRGRRRRDRRASRSRRCARQIAAIPDGTLSRTMRSTIEGTDGRADARDASVDGAGRPRSRCRLQRHRAPRSRRRSTCPCATRKAMAWSTRSSAWPRRHIPNNHRQRGTPVTVSCARGLPAATRCRPRRPAGGTSSGTSSMPLTMFGALAEALPDRVQADSGMLNLVSMTGPHPRRATGCRASSSRRAATARCRASTALPTTPSPVEHDGHAGGSVGETSPACSVAPQGAAAPTAAAPGEFRGGLGQAHRIRQRQRWRRAHHLLPGRAHAASRRRAWPAAHPALCAACSSTACRCSAKGRYILASRATG
jgi:hypothetical protein